MTRMTDKRHNGLSLEPWAASDLRPDPGDSEAPHHPVVIL